MPNLPRDWFPYQFIALLAAVIAYAAWDGVGVALTQKCNAITSFTNPQNSD